MPDERGGRLADPGLTIGQRDDAESRHKLVAWVRSHWALRITVGVVAVLLPLIVVALVALLENGLLTSLSDAYHHRYANSVFVGSMFAFAAFLWAYDYKRSEDVWGNRASLAALGVAIFSTTPQRRLLTTDHVVLPGLRPQVYELGPSTLDTVGGVIHFVSAVAFFVALTRFCRIWELDEESDGHAAIYRWTRFTIYAGLAGAVLSEVASRVLGEVLTPPSDTTALALRLCSTAFLLFEVLMVEAFGFSWLVRGSVDPRAAGRAMVAVAVPLLLITALYTVEHVIALDAPEPVWTGWVSGVLGLAGVVLALVSLRRHLPTFGLRLGADDASGPD